MQNAVGTANIDEKPDKMVASAADMLFEYKTASSSIIPLLDSALTLVTAFPMRPEDRRQGGRFLSEARALMQAEVDRTNRMAIGSMVLIREIVNQLLSAVEVFAAWGWPSFTRLSAELRIMSLDLFGRFFVTSPARVSMALIAVPVDKCPSLARELTLVLNIVGLMVRRYYDLCSSHTVMNLPDASFFKHRHLVIIGNVEKAARAGDRAGMLNCIRDYEAGLSEEAGLLAQCDPSSSSIMLLADVEATLGASPESDLNVVLRKMRKAGYLIFSQATTYQWNADEQEEVSLQSLLQEELTQSVEDHLVSGRNLLRRFVDKTGLLVAIIARLSSIANAAEILSIVNDVMGFWRKDRRGLLFLSQAMSTDSVLIKIALMFCKYARDTASVSVEVREFEQYLRRNRSDLEFIQRIVRQDVDGQHCDLREALQLITDCYELLSNMLRHLNAVGRTSILKTLLDHHNVLLPETDDLLSDLICTNVSREKFSMPRFYAVLGGVQTYLAELAKLRGQRSTWLAADSISEVVQTLEINARKLRSLVDDPSISAEDLIEPFKMVKHALFSCESKFFCRIAGLLLNDEHQRPSQAPSDASFRADLEDGENEREEELLSANDADLESVGDIEKTVDNKSECDARLTESAGLCFLLCC